jgi:large subunit ribosomal protein L24
MKAQPKVVNIRIKKGDTVVVISGAQKGKTGTVVKTHPTLNKVTVEGINVVKKHVKPTQAKPTGGIVEITKPIWVSKVAVVEPTTKKPSRIRFAFDKNGNKVREYVRTGKEMK